MVCSDGIHGMEGRDIDETGYIFNIQKFSIHDGPGIRTLIFFKGCPLRCIWCSNPESQNIYPEIFYLEERCTLCKMCEAVCPRQRKKISKNAPVYDKQCIMDCDKPCVKECSKEAMVVTGEKTTVRTVVSSVTKDQEYYFLSDGGVTVTGGEPFYQPRFLLSLVRVLKYLNIHVAVETCGFFDYEKNRESVDLIDCYLYDIKNVDARIHRQHTGLDNALIKNNLMRLVDGNKNVIVRIPIISGINDNEDDLSKVVDFLSPIYSRLLEINILPYHKLGVIKYRRLGMDYSLDIEPASKERLEEIREIFKRSGIDANVIE